MTFKSLTGGLSTDLGAGKQGEDAHGKTEASSYLEPSTKLEHSRQLVELIGTNLGAGKEGEGRLPPRQML